MDKSENAFDLIMSLAILTKTPFAVRLSKSLNNRLLFLFFDKSTPSFYSNGSHAI